MARGIVIQKIPEDISMEDVLKKMTGCNDRQLAMMKQGIEMCEYNPLSKRAAYSGDEPGACESAATVCVGHNGKWHLCFECAALPEFRKFKSRHSLSRS